MLSCNAGELNILPSSNNSYDLVISYEAILYRHLFGSIKWRNNNFTFPSFRQFDRDRETQFLLSKEIKLILSIKGNTQDGVCTETILYNLISIHRGGAGRTGVRQFSQSRRKAFDPFRRHRGRLRTSEGRGQQNNRHFGRNASLFQPVLLE